jgi:hypothetical protein
MEQTVISVAAFSVVVFVVGIGCGLLAGHFVLPGQRRSRRLQAELNRANEEYAAYKASVTTHFHKTADLVGQLTETYRSVYDHLATGARSLCDRPLADTAIQLAESRLLEDSDGKKAA